MNVLVFTTLFPNNVWPNHGVFVKERVAHVARSDERAVRVVAPVPYCPPFSLGGRQRFSRVVPHEVIEGLPVSHPRFFMTPKIGMTLYGLMMFLSVLPAMRRIRREFAFDLIDAHYVYPDGLAAVLLGRYFRCPVVVSARGSDINLFATLPLIRPLLRFTLRRADRVVAVSGALKEAIAALGIPAERISVIPNGVDAQKFRPVPQADARQALGLPADRPVVLSVGGMNPVKGFDLLLRAFRLTLDGQIRRPYLVIVGDGAERTALEAQASALDLRGDVRFAGSVPHLELYQWYSAADVFCLASRREGWPNVVLEALACGVPVVSTEVGGVPEIVTSETLGLLVTRDERALAAGIVRALGTTWQGRAIVEHARARSWEGVAGAVLDTFDSLFDRTSGSHHSAPSGPRLSDAGQRSIAALNQRTR